MQLTAHFQLREFTSRDGAQVPAAAVNELRELCRRYLEPLREKFGPVTISSGYRSPAHNTRVGGAPRSFHRYDIAGRQGVAADVTCRRGTVGEWYAFLDRLQPGGLGRYATFVHVDSRYGHARW